MPPKLLCTSTPIVHPPNAAGNARDELPIPPFQPKATVPAPAPTLPSVTGPDDAAAIADRTSAAVIGRERMALRVPSFVSATTGLIEWTFSIPGCSSIHPT